MLLRSLLGKVGMGDWARLAQLVSPDFFKVLPLSEMMSVISKGVTHSKSFQGETGLGSQSFQDLQSAFKQRRFTSKGEAALFIFFRQILSGKKLCLDLSSSAFVYCDGELIWKPKSLCYELSDEFWTGLRLVYLGFYGDSEDDFKVGFKKMGLTGGEAIFLDHFGDQNQEKVEFQLRKCIDTFDKIFREFRARNLKLPGEIIPLGVGLSLLYENLETEARTFNVRSLFKLASEGLQR